MSKKKKRIKVRRSWTRSPIEQIVPNKRREEPLKFNDNLYRGQKITEEDLDMLEDDFGRGFHD